MKKITELKNSFLKINQHYVKLGCIIEDLEQECFSQIYKFSKLKFFIGCFLVLVISLFYKLNYIYYAINYLLGIRCILPNNYFIWEATRPISNCNFCTNVSEPVILSNLSRDEFKSFAYSSQPMVIREAFIHWPAIKTFSLNFFRDLYEQIEDGHKSVDEECQFLHFKSDFISIKDVFSMSDKRSQNSPLENSWYVGW